MSQGRPQPCAPFITCYDTKHSTCHANITPEIEAFARIKVLGVGGSGGNAVNHMISSKVRGVDFICINTDSQDLHRAAAKKRVHIGKNLTAAWALA